MLDACATGGKVLAFGNGGSAADAQHFAAELVGRFEHERAGMAAVALTTDTCTLTSVANDYGFERVFARQIEALGRAGDVAVGDLDERRVAERHGGAEGSRRARVADDCADRARTAGRWARWRRFTSTCRTTPTARVQEVHMTLIHAICGIVERRS